MRLHDSIGKKRELRSHWQRVAKLILAQEGRADRVQGAGAGIVLQYQAGRVESPMKSRTHFAHRIDILDATEIQEYLAGAVWREAIVRWPGTTNYPRPRGVSRAPPASGQMKQPHKASSGPKPKAITYLGHVIRISPLDKKFIANVFDPDQTKPEPIYTTTEDSVHVAEDKARRFIERWTRWIETKKKAENWE